MIDFAEEEKAFRKRLDENFYTLDRAKNTGDDYVRSGKLDRDTEAVIAFSASSDFDVIRNLR